MKLIRSHPLTPEEIQKIASLPRNPISVVLNNVRSLYNVGAIFRTSDAARIEKLYLTGLTGHPPKSEISKTALSTTDTVPWEYQPSALAVVKDLKQQGIQIVALERCETSTDFTTVSYTFPLALILGHEKMGIEDQLLAEADHIIHIPMLGAAHSLNVATAYGVAVFEILRHIKTTIES